MMEKLSNRKHFHSTCWAWLVPCLVCFFIRFTLLALSPSPKPPSKDHAAHLLSSSLLLWLCETPWWILAPHTPVSMEWKRSLVCAISLLYFSFHLTRQEMQSCSHMNQSEPPSGNVCWSFQVLFLSRGHEREGEINLEQLQEAKDRGNFRRGVKGEGTRLI